MILTNQFTVIQLNTGQTQFTEDEARDKLDLRCAPKIEHGSRVKKRFKGALG